MGRGILSFAPPPNFFFKSNFDKLLKRILSVFFSSVFRIRLILIWIRILGSVSWIKYQFVKNVFFISLKNNLFWYLWDNYLCPLIKIFEGKNMVFLWIYYLVVFCVEIFHYTGWFFATRIQNTFFFNEFISHYT